jgi:hypothetical protein
MKKVTTTYEIDINEDGVEYEINIDSGDRKGSHKHKSITFGELANTISTALTSRVNTTQTKKVVVTIDRYE